MKSWKKGSNMLLDQLKLNVKLSDFGAARKLATLDRSRTDNLVGTTYWMSPEVIRGKFELVWCANQAVRGSLPWLIHLGCAAGPENDVWAFGITLIEMLTGSPPFKELDPLPAMFKIASTEPNFGNFKINVRISSTLIVSDILQKMTRTSTWSPLEVTVRIWTRDSAPSKVQF